MIALLHNPVRHYAWGSTTALPELLGIAPDGRPFAELWLGAHPSASSRLCTAAGEESLDAVLGSAPGEPALPFLLKILAAEQPLSLQVHPSREQARAGHADEEARGVPADAPDRRFPDPNHKPELLCAITPFELAVGFRAPHEVAGLLDVLGVAPLAEDAATLRATPDDSGVRAVLARWLRLPPAEATALSEAVSAAVLDLPTTDAAAAATYAQEVANLGRLAVHFPGDIGIVVALLMHHLSLAPGDGLFVPPGMVHTYLHGTAAEILASSDNVARAGLTPKHIDVEAVLALVDTTPAPPIRVAAQPSAAGEDVYESPIEDFRLSRLTLHERHGVRLPAVEPAILFVLDGAIEVRQGGLMLQVPAGGSAFVAADGPDVEVTVGPGSTTARVFRATTARAGLAAVTEPN